MESKVKLLGHPVHPMLIVFPLGLLITAVIFDVVYFVTDIDSFTTVAFWCIAAGVIGGLLAAIFGLIDCRSAAGCGCHWAPARSGVFAGWAGRAANARPSR